MFPGNGEASYEGQGNEYHERIGGHVETSLDDGVVFEGCALWVWGCIAHCKLRESVIAYSEGQFGVRE